VDGRRDDQAPPPRPATQGGRCVSDHPGAGVPPLEAGCHRWVMNTTTRIFAVSGRLWMSRWPGQTRRSKSHQARGVSARSALSRAVSFTDLFTNAVLAGASGHRSPAQHTICDQDIRRGSLVVAEPPAIPPLARRAATSGTPQLRQDPNARFLRDRGFLFRRRVWFVGTCCPPTRIDGARYGHFSALHRSTQWPSPGPAPRLVVVRRFLLLGVRQL
jgi:hypothetical protein